MQVKYPGEERQYGAAARFIDKKLQRGIVSFSLDELILETGLSPIAAKNQLLRLGRKVVRVRPRQPYFLIVQPERFAFGAPPPTWWLDGYFRWLKKPYYVALLSAAAAYGSSHQAVQETQVMTDSCIRTITIGRIRVRFFMKYNIANSKTRQLPMAHAPLVISTPETTAYDLFRYADRIGGLERAREVIQPIMRQMKSNKLRAVIASERHNSTAQLLEATFAATVKPRKR